jgi:2-C-methyl-D-erythritol 4-phosphate cytidylyltransferase
VPAAGSSQRMRGDVPKQYLPLAGRAVIEWSLAPLLLREDIDAIVVVLAPGDQRWQGLPVARQSKIITAIGGTERAESVRAGLAAFSERAADHDWILVHDAARPCLPKEDLERLMIELRDDEVGGLLAAAVVDTLKRADAEGRVLETVVRTALWRALTPQMFRYGVLRRALQQTTNVTDEAQAVEALGLRPRLIAGVADNIKITVATDLGRAERILRESGAT